MPTLLKSVERLTHFRCGACNSWWSIGDALERDHWFCPRRGAKLETLTTAEQISERPVKAKWEFENE